MKIQSISDLITNSSTEVFIVWEESIMDTIKELVNGILALTSNKTFEDYFDIKMIYDYWQIVDHFDDDPNAMLDPDCPSKIRANWDDMTFSDQVHLLKEDKDALDFCLEIASLFGDIYNGYQVTAKCPEAEEIARNLTQFPDKLHLDYYENR